MASTTINKEDNKSRTFTLKVVIIIKVIFRRLKQWLKNKTKQANE